ncbi:Alginate biosynthesis sensor protein KinB [compost metagenome]
MAGLLGLVGLAVLIIGFVTAHAIARRFGAPIEALVQAADNIGQGNFEVTLPVSSAEEMNQLTKRCGIMAEALREHQATNIDELLAGQQRSLPRLALDDIDVIQRALVFGDQAIAQRVEFFGEFTAPRQHPRCVR